MPTITAIDTTSETLHTWVSAIRSKEITSEPLSSTEPLTEKSTTLIILLLQEYIKTTLRIIPTLGYMPIYHGGHAVLFTGSVDGNDFAYWLYGDEKGWHLLRAHKLTAR
jgi:hypothetical protein